MTVPFVFRLSAILVRVCAAFGRRACQVWRAWAFVSCFVAMTLGFALLTHNAQAEYPEESIWIDDFAPRCDGHYEWDSKSVISFPGKEITLTGGTRACRNWMDARATVIRNETEKRCLNEDERCDGRWDPSNECLTAQGRLRLITKIKGKEKDVSEGDICRLYVGYRECVPNIRKKIRSCESDIKRLAPPMLVAALSVQADFEAQYESRKEEERRKQAAEQERRRKQQEAERKEREAKDEYKDTLQSASDDSEAFAAYEKCVENENFHSFKGVACDSLYLWPENRRRLLACVGKRDKLACAHELDVREARCESLRQSAYDPRWHERLSYWWDATAWFRAKYLYEQECGE